MRLTHTLEEEFNHNQLIFLFSNASSDTADYQFVLKKIKIKINGNLTKNLT